jgi:hypothetical protein
LAAPAFLFARQKNRHLSRNGGVFLEHKTGFNRLFRPFWQFQKNIETLRCEFSGTGSSPAVAVRWLSIAETQSWLKNSEELP